MIQHQRVCTTHLHLKQIPSCPADLQHRLVTNGVAADVWGCFWVLFCSQGTTFLPGLPSYGRILLGVVVVGGEAASKGRHTCPSSLLRGLPGLFLQMGLPPGLPPASQAGPLCLRAFVPAGAPAWTLAPGACTACFASFLFQRDLPLALCLKLQPHVPLITPSAHFQL